MIQSALHLADTKADFRTLNSLTQNSCRKKNVRDFQASYTINLKKNLTMWVIVAMPSRTVAIPTLWHVSTKTRSYMSDPFLLVCMMWRKTRSYMSDPFLLVGVKWRKTRPYMNDLFCLSVWIRKKRGLT